MARIFSFALGNIWQWEKKRADLVKYVRKLDIAGVELTIASPKELFEFKLSSSDRKWLKNLDYVSIHAPFFDFGSNKDKSLAKKGMDHIFKLYKEVGAKNVVIHIDELPPKNLLKNYNFNISTENFEEKKHYIVSALRKVFAEYPKMGLCLDISHTYTFNKNETKKLIKEFKSRITQVHFSGTYRKKCHRSLRNVSRDFLWSIKPLKELDVPIVIEEDIKKKSIKYLKDELAYIKKLIG